MGRVVATRNCLDHMVKIGENAIRYLALHQNREWGLLTQEDKQANDRALREGGRILSKYRLKDRVTHIYIITEADRSYTTVMLTSDY